MVNENFCSDKKIGAIFGPFFGPKFGHFRSKIRFLDIFFENAHQICLKLGQKLWAIALNHRMAVLCLGKFLFWPFLAIFGSKIHCMWWVSKIWAQKVIFSQKGGLNPLFGWKWPFEPKSSKPTTCNVFLTQKWPKTAKTRIFPDTTLPFDDSKQLPTVSDQVLNKSDVRFQRKCPKTWFLSENGQILDQKRVQKWPRFFCQNKNFHWPFLNNKLSLNSKT